MASDILKEAQEAFKECQEREHDNRLNFEADVRFARLEEQWPSDIETRFGDDPRLTINKLAPVIRQVVNDARQNKPQISVRPQDSEADPETAEIMSGLIRNIESASDADTAYDTAVDNAVSGGFGYFRINTRYACDDNWDQDIVIDRVINPLSIYGDPYSTAADSSDWNVAFVTDQMSKKAFEKKYKGGTSVSWEAAEFPEEWLEGEQVTIAEYWTRSEVRKQIYLLSDGRTISADELKKSGQELYDAGIEVMGQPRDVMSYKVTQRILTGIEELEKTEWQGKYIPIIPVYGDEVVLKNKRYFRSLIRSAIDAQRMYNYWASKTTAVVALAPRAPYIGEEGSFSVDPNWDKANDESLPYLEYKKGMQMPQRQPFAGVPTGMMQEMMAAAEHIKAVTGIYDASLGARSNETSGVAIRNRQMEGDVSTFHFIDNLSRAIRHGGRVLIDLIPKVYTTDRVIRVLGIGGEAQTIPLGQQAPVLKNGKPVADETGQAMTRIYDLTVGKYDLAVEAGPSYTTRREEARAEIVEIIRAVPDSAAVLGPMYLRNSDWPGADEAADKLEGGAEGPQIPPEVQEQMQAMQQQLQEGAQAYQQMEQELAAAKADQQGKAAELQMKQQEMGMEGQAKQAEMGMKQQEMQLQVQIKQAELAIKERELAIKEQELQVKMFEAETDRIQAMKPEPDPQPPSDRAAA